MLNLLMNLKKFRYSDTGVAGNMLLLLSFFSGSVLFWLFGLSIFGNCVFLHSDSILLIAIMAALTLVMLSAFSQLGIIQIAVFDAALEFLVSAFVFVKLSQSGDYDSITLICFQVFALSVVAIFCSQRSLSASVNVLRSSLANKYFTVEFAVNLLILIALFAIVLIICLKAF